MYSKQVSFNSTNCTKTNKILDHTLVVYLFNNLYIFQDVVNAFKEIWNSWSLLSIIYFGKQYSKYTLHITFLEFCYSRRDEQLKLTLCL